MVGISLPVRAYIVWIKIIESNLCLEPAPNDTMITILPEDIRMCTRFAKGKIEIKQFNHRIFRGWTRSPNNETKCQKVNKKPEVIL